MTEALVLRHRAAEAKHSRRLTKGADPLVSLLH